jgi:hypothetical protein
MLFMVIENFRNQDAGASGGMANQVSVVYSFPEFSFCHKDMTSS